MTFSLLAIKRIMQEAKELASDPSTDYTAAPLEVSILSSNLAEHLITYDFRTISLYVTTVLTTHDQSLMVGLL